MGAKWIKGDEKTPIGRAVIYAVEKRLLTKQPPVIAAVCTSLADLIILPVNRNSIDSVLSRIQNEEWAERVTLDVKTTDEIEQLRADIIFAGFFHHDEQVQTSVTEQVNRYMSSFEDDQTEKSNYSSFGILQGQVSEIIQKQAEHNAKLYRERKYAEADKRLHQTLDLYKGATFIKEVFKLFKYAHDKNAKYDPDYAKLIAQKIHAMIFGNDEASGAIERKIKEYEMMKLK